MNKTILSLLSLALGVSVIVATPSAARTYQEVVVRGADLIPADDISKTCGELQDIYLDEVELNSVEDCLMSTGVFERVSVTGEGDMLVIHVDEIEQQPGRIDAAVSWMNDRGLTGTLSYNQFNLIPDTYTSVQGDFGQEAESFDINLYRPEAFGPDLHFGIDVVGQRTDYDDLAFSVRSYQAEVYLALTPDDSTRLEYGFGYRDHRMYDLDADASPLLRQEEDQLKAPFLRFGFSYRKEPEGGAGFSAQFEQFLWNIGTSRPVSETRLELESRQSAGFGNELLVGLDAGLIAGLSGNDTTALDRVFPGGDSFRGFAPRGIGPAEEGDLLGGNRYLILSIELQRDLGRVMDREIRGGIFTDIGTVWALDNAQGGRIDDDADIRSSLGLSLTFDIAETPISLYAAAPLKRQSQDKRQNFGLSVSARF
jgi:outer membrane protein insertion porin family